MSQIHLVLPTHVYDKKYLPNADLIIIYEHPHYFTDYNYNKKVNFIKR